MNWLMRRRAASGLRRLGHSPRWRRDRKGYYAVCADCPWGWGGDALRPENLATTLRRTATCRGGA